MSPVPSPRPPRVPRSAALVALFLLVLTACGTGGPARDGADRSAGAVPSEATSPGSEPREGRTLDRDLHPVLRRAVEHGPRRPGSPAETATQVRVTEDAIADPGTEPDVLAAAAHQQQVTYRVLGTKRGWDARVRERLPDRLVPVAGRNVQSRREFRSMHYRLSDTLPAWRIVEPAPAEELLRYYRRAQQEYGVDWEFLAAINLVETGMGRIRGTSVAGAQGPMQFMPGTWEQYGEGDVNSPRDAIMAAARYLDAMGFNRPGGKARALYRYNNHPAYVRGVTRLAEVMQQQPRAFHGYYHWEVYYLTDVGDVRLPVGYERQRPIKVRRYLENNPRA